MFRIAFGELQFDQKKNKYKTLGQPRPHPRLTFCVVLGAFSSTFQENCRFSVHVCTFAGFRRCPARGVSAAPTRTSATTRGPLPGSIYWNSMPPASIPLARLWNAAIEVRRPSKPFHRGYDPGIVFEGNHARKHFQTAPAIPCKLERAVERPADYIER